MENPVFTRANLFDVKVIMAIMHVLMEELLCQPVMGWVLVLECLFIRCVWVPVVMFYHAWH
jgi:hypothetical protein